MASDARDKFPFFYEKNIENKILYAKVVGRGLEFLTITMVPSHYLSGALFSVFVCIPIFRDKESQ